MQVVVELKVAFLKMNDIDTRTQQFDADVFVQAKWEEVSLNGMDQQVIYLAIQSNVVHNGPTGNIPIKTVKHGTLGPTSKKYLQSQSSIKQQLDQQVRRTYKARQA